ncbi:MAG: 30S ribosomal protein S27e [Nanoarchaeota archaeon]|nr:30S ribosomal protein S27e [Nanoarchaeota archaeon]
MEEIAFKPIESKFVKVRCKKCKNEQVIFRMASTEVKCLVCGEVLAKPTGGKAEILAEIIENYK